MNAILQRAHLATHDPLYIRPGCTGLFDSESETDVPSDSSDEELVEV